MRTTLLDMVQDILSALESDEVNSITDTVEALQVARVIRDSYYEIISRLDAPEHRSFYELLSSGDNSKPTLMTLPTGVDSLEWVRYNKLDAEYPSPNFVDIQLLSVPDFLDRVYQLKTTDTNVGTYQVPVGSDTFDILYRDDKHPEFYTILSDEIILFDSFRLDLDNTLVKNKTMAYGILIPTFSLEDTFIPDLDDNLFSLLKQESKAQAFGEIKQSQNATAEKKARRQWIHAQKSKEVVQDDPYREFSSSPNFGRRGRGGSSSHFITPKSQRAW